MMNINRRIILVAILGIAESIILYFFWEDIINHFQINQEEKIPAWFGSFITMIVASPIIFFIWSFRDEDKRKDLLHTEETIRQADFHKIEEWSTEIAKADTETNTGILQIAAIYQLLPYLKGVYGNRFVRPTMEIYHSLLSNKQWDKEQNIDDRVKKMPHIVAIHKIFTQESEFFRKFHKSPVCKQNYNDWIPLEGINLRDADLTKIVLTEGDFTNGDFRDVKFGGADLRRAIFIGADFRGSDLRQVDLREADLREADLRRTNLRGANLKGANFRNAKLEEADFEEKDFEKADTKGTILEKLHIHNFDQEKLTELAHKLAQRYREKDTQTIKELERAVTALSQQDAGKYNIQQALDLLSQGKTEEAEKIFELVAIEAGQKGQDWNSKKVAEAERQVGALTFIHNTQKSIQAYKRSIESEPDSIISLINLGRLYQRIGELAQAEEAFLRVLKLAGNNKESQAVAYGNLGTVYYTQGNLDKAIIFYEKALAIDEALGRKEGMAIQYGNLGSVCRTRGELDKAVEFYVKAFALNQELGNKEGMANQYSNLGVVYDIRGELDKAVEFYEKALAINQELGSKEGLAIQYGNLGNVSLTRGELDKAVEFYEKALAINQELGNKEGMAIQYGNLGTVCRTRGDLDKAIELHEKALAIHRELGSKEGLAIQYGNLGTVYRIRGELDKAVEFYEKSLAIDKELGRKQGMANQYGNLGSVCRTRGDLDKTVEFYEKALALFKEIGAKREIAQTQSLLDEVHQIQTTPDTVD